MPLPGSGRAGTASYVVGLFGGYKRGVSPTDGRAAVGDPRIAAPPPVAPDDAYGQLIAGHYPVAWYRLDGNTDDAMGGSPGTLTNGAALSTTIIGGYSGAQSVQLDGSNDYIVVPDQPKLRLTDPITVEAWAVADSTSAGFHAIAGSVWWLVERNGNRFSLFTQGAGTQTGATTTIVPGTAYHVAVVWSGGTASLYVNGALEVTQSYTWPGQVTNGFRIGTYDGTSEFWDGRVDEVAVYARALTPTELGEHYAAGQAVPATVAGVTATATAAALPGTVTAAATAVGAIAAATAAGLPGTLAAPANITGQTATATTTAVPGTATGAATIVGTVAAVTADAPAGVAVGLSGGTILGVTATATATAPAGTAVVPADVTGQTATATAQATPGTASGLATITGTTATATATAGAGAATAGALVLGQPAAATALAQAGNAQAAASITGATGTVTAQGRPGAAVAVVRNLTITVAPGRSRTLTTTGATRRLAATATGTERLTADGTTRRLVAAGMSRSLTADPRE